ncbi:hypothetical protein Tco_1100505, partial [Tanacetum coccineum]
KAWFQFPVMDSDAFFEESNTSLSHLDNSLPEFETFSNHTEEMRSGSTTTHANYTLPEINPTISEASRIRYLNLQLTLELVLNCLNGDIRINPDLFKYLLKQEFVRIRQKSQENRQKRANTDTRTEERARVGSQSQKVNLGQLSKSTQEDKTPKYSKSVPQVPKVTQMVPKA